MQVSVYHEDGTRSTVENVDAIGLTDQEQGLEYVVDYGEGGKGKAKHLAIRRQLD